MKKLVLFLACSISLMAQTLAFSPQGGKKVQEWIVVGCGVKPLPASQIYTIATSKGIPWLVPEKALELLKKKTIKGRLCTYIGWGAAGTSLIMGLDFVKARPEIETGVGMGSTFFNALVPFATRNVPTIDSNAGKGLTIGPDGCGQASFYAVGGVGGPFIYQVVP